MSHLLVNQGRENKELLWVTKNEIESAFISSDQNQKVGGPKIRYWVCQGFGQSKLG